ncbi:MAG: PKD domain-containing protein [Flavobacteriales bacterium]
MMNTSMRRLLLLSIALFALSVTSSAQERASCPVDTITYIKSKTSTEDTLTFKPNEMSAAYQYFECPQSISVRGARFYGFKPNYDSGNTVLMTVELVTATNDSVPGTSVLASANAALTVPDSFNGPLSSYGIVVTWAPVTVSQPYTIVVRSSTSSPHFCLFHNNIDTAGPDDGKKEWLGGVKQAVSWIRPYDFEVDTSSGQLFDADFIFEPIVNYNITASFTNDPECLFDELGDTVHFFNTGAPIIDSRMYNRYARFNQPDRQLWNYGDGSPLEEIVDPAHFYPTNGPYVATLTTKMLTWTYKTCQSTATQIIKEKPEQDFSYKTNNLDVQFTNQTFGTFSDIHYDFGDGNSSLSENPKHKYAEPGNYWVCQTMMTSCGEVKYCQNVAVATNTALNCGKDSVKYTSAKGTDVKWVRLKNTGPGILYGLGQTFPANQSIIVHGFSFYANHNGLFKDSYPVTCRIYDLVNGYPDSTKHIAESVVYINKYEVDTNYSDTTRYTAIFNKPAQIKKDYVLTIEYDSAHPVFIGTNDWLVMDGANEFRALGKINDSTWARSQEASLFNINGAAFNADVIIEPIVEYNFDANFYYEFRCLDTAAPQNFYDNSSPIVRSKVYNKTAFYSSNVNAFEWNFDDGSEIENTIDAVHSFIGSGPFDVSLNIVMDGWTVDCISQQVHNVPVPPNGGYVYEQVTSTVQFYDHAKNADEYLWTFTDGTVSTLKSPIHYFTSLGSFQVCQYVSNECGSDTTCDSITVDVLGIPSDVVKGISIYPNPASDYIHVSADFNLMERLKVDLHDMSGRCVKTIVLTSSTPQEQLYVGDLSRGSYIVKIKADQFEGTKKFVLMD